MDTTTLARLLFFTRAAVEDNPQLSNSRFPLSGSILRNLAHHQGALSLPLKNWYHFWDNTCPTACARCGCPVLHIVPGNGEKIITCNRMYGYCPSCGSVTPNHGTGKDRAVFGNDDVSLLLEEVSSDEHTGMELPYQEVLVRLWTLRNEDILNEDHPVERASLARWKERWLDNFSWIGDSVEQMKLISEHTAEDVEEAKIRAVVATPEILRRLFECRGKLVLDAQAKCDMAGTASSSGPGVDKDAWLSAVVTDALRCEAEKLAGRQFSDDERLAFMLVCDLLFE